MNVPILSKRREATRKSIEAQAMTKALVAIDQSLVETGTIEKSFLTGNAATMMSSKGSRPGTPNKQPGTSWSSQTSLSNKLIQRVTQNLSSGFEQAPEELEVALAEQGLSWGPPFPPGRPLDPFYGYRKPARTYDYAVGENVQLTPRWNRVSFPTIKSIYEAYDVAQICVRHLINDVRSLDYNWEPIPGVKTDVSAEIEQAIEFFYSPDKRQPFRTWLAEWLQDVLRYDAGALYIRRNNGDEPIALEVVSGTTIIPLVDFYGRRPEDEDDESAVSEDLFTGKIVPAYVQIIEGLPWNWLASDDLLYQPWNPLPDSQYGLAPLEAVLLSANTDIRFQWHFLQFFTEGTLPAGFMEAPPDMSDPAQIASWQEAWDAVMQGDQTKTRQIRWVPSGSKFTSSKPDADKFSPDFVLYLARRTMAAFGVTPNDLGFTEDVNRATGDTQVDVQFRVGTSPLLRYAEDVINLFVKEHLGLRVRLRFDDGKETEDRVATATADSIYIDHGVKGIDETRAELGLPIDKSKPSPRFINNTRAGPIPLISLESMAGGIDPDTYGVADSQKLIDTPYIAPPGIIPVAGTPEEKAAHEATASASNAMRAGTPDAGPTDVEGTHDTSGEGDDEGAAAGGTEEPATSIEKMLALLDEIEKGIGSSAIDNTGGPGLGKGAGLTVATGVQGVDLDDDDEDEVDDATKAALVALSLRRWRDNSRNRLRKGQAPKRFIDPTLPEDVYAEVWSKLRKAGTRQEVDAAFAAVGKRKAGARPARTTNGTPGFHKHTQTIVDYYTPLIAKALGESLSLADIEAAVKRKAGVAKEAAPSEPDSVLRSQLDNSALQQVLTHLRGDAAIQGTIEAAVSAGSGVASDLQCVVNQLPSDYWDKWQPGFGKAADAELERGADDRIKGMTDTSLERLTNTISDGLTKGDSVQTTAKAALEDLGSTARAEMVVNTEYATSMTEANLETYKEAGVEQLEWMAEGDACPECEENEAASPLAAGDDWPNGDVPVHPNCRCAIAPVVADEAEKGIALKDLQGIVDGLYEDKKCDVVTPELPPGAVM
jgi:SPP1 gp7 family putative phage head morphogenesis protein